MHAKVHTYPGRDRDADPRVDVATVRRAAERWAAGDRQNGLQADKIGGRWQSKPAWIRAYDARVEAARSQRQSRGYPRGRGRSRIEQDADGGEAGE